MTECSIIELCMINHVYNGGGTILPKSAKLSAFLQKINVKIKEYLLIWRQNIILTGNDYEKEASDK